MSYLRVKYSARKFHPPHFAGPPRNSFGTFPTDPVASPTFNCLFANKNLQPIFLLNSTCHYKKLIQPILQYQFVLWLSITKATFSRCECESSVISCLHVYLHAELAYDDYDALLSSITRFRLAKCYLSCLLPEILKSVGPSGSAFLACQ